MLQTFGRIESSRMHVLDNDHTMYFAALLLAIAFASQAVSPAFAQDKRVQQGRDIAATCAGCHGTNGVSVGEVPSLAAQPKELLMAKMRTFKEGRGRTTIMSQLMQGYTDQQMELVAAWFEAQKR